MTVCLVMIVKDEEAVIGRCLRSALPHVDHVVLCDTGSTDATLSIARSFLKQTVPYEVYVDEWVDFGHNRSLALERARGKADYLLLMDADMALQVDGRLPDDDAVAYDLLVTDPTDAGFVYRLPALLRGDENWESEGVTHEYTSCDGAAPAARPFDGWKLVHHCDGHRRPTKFMEDLLALQAQAAADPDDERTAFYLAETYRNLGMFDVAIAQYEKRAEMGGWQEEVYYSLYQIGCLKSAHWDFGRGCEALAECHRRFPHRAEPLRAISRAAVDVARKIDAVPEGIFVDRGAYIGAC